MPVFNETIPSCAGVEGGPRQCPECQTSLSASNCIEIVAPRGLPLCKWRCECPNPNCQQVCCCEREAPTPKPRPPRP
jgi:hypothetical protein